MALAKDCAQHVSTFVFGSAAVACGVAGAGVPALLGGAALITTGLAAAHEKNQKQGAESKRVLKKIIGQVTVVWRDETPERTHFEQRDISNASDALIEFLPQCEMSRDRLVACATDASAVPFPQAATALVMEELATKAPASFGAASPAIAQDFAQAVISAAFQTAIEDRAYFEKLEPHLLFEIARTQGLAIGMLSQIISTLDKISEEVAHAVVDEWERRGHHTPAYSSVLRPETILALGQQYPNANRDIDGVVKDLLNNNSHRSGSMNETDQLASAGIQEVRQALASGEIEQAVQKAKAALAQWDTQDIVQRDVRKKSRSAILDILIEAESASLNAAGAAEAIAEKLRWETKTDVE